MCQRLTCWGSTVTMGDIIADTVQETIQTYRERERECILPDILLCRTFPHRPQTARADITVETRRGHRPLSVCSQLHTHTSSEKSSEHSRLGKGFRRLLNLLERPPLNKPAVGQQQQPENWENPGNRPNRLCRTEHCLMWSRN